jgi:hypothetical protein
MKRHSIAITAAFAAVGLAGCSSMSTNPDEVGLVYNAGPLSNTQFDVCVQPGNKEWDGPSDKHIAYPAGQRTYRFDADKGADRGAFGINTKDPIELQVSGVVAFELNTDCEVLQQFHEKIGNKYTPAVDDSKTTGEWRDFLNDYLGVALKRALTDATQNTGWAPLYTDTKAIRQTQVAVQENKAQTEKNAKINTELESIRELVKVLGPDGYNTYKAIEAGKITVMPIPQGSGVVLNGGPK